MQYDAGIYLGEQFKGTKIPLLEELLAAAEGTGTIIALDKNIPNDQLHIMFDVVEKYKTPVCYSVCDSKRIIVIQERFPNAMIDYDGNTTEEDLELITSLVKPENLLVWLYLDTPNFAWLKDRYKASVENCERVKKYARLGLGNVYNPYDVIEALNYKPDVLEL